MDFLAVILAFLELRGVAGEEGLDFWNLGMGEGVEVMMMVDGDEGDVPPDLVEGGVGEEAGAEGIVGGGLLLAPGGLEIKFYHKFKEIK